MAMEMAMMGLLGTVVGASAMGIGGIAKSIAEAYVPGVAAAKDRRQQMNVDLQARRYEAVRVWRSGLCSASNAYRQWEAGSRDTHAPNVVGDEWFEGLRPHLPTTGEAAKFRTASAGVSNYSLARWRKADAALGRPVVSNQVHFSLAHPDALEDLVPFAELENRIVIAYSPLAQGLLGGKYGLENRPGGVRALNPLFGTENLRRIEPLLATLRAIAVDVDAKPAQVALAWLISLPGVVAIPGASSVEQLEFNVAAADIELSAQSRDALTDAARAFRPVSTGRFLTDMVREKVSRR